ncbi:Os08g0470550 [Oryza sativa Japonica Group]|uniref:Os08g0470550 protein n=1 Tax=Oryza sativa subsp. japonica TaxID=39947 RepID=A0A0P0XGP3_ORYSJ|nr:Os08g0470550 [Oryza sativa Japonica Group]
MLVRSPPVSGAYRCPARLSRLECFAWRRTHRVRASRPLQLVGAAVGIASRRRHSNGRLQCRARQWLSERLRGGGAGSSSDYLSERAGASQGLRSLGDVGDAAGRSWRSRSRRWRRRRQLPELTHGDSPPVAAGRRVDWWPGRSRELLRATEELGAAGWSAGGGVVGARCGISNFLSMPLPGCRLAAR